MSLKTPNEANLNAQYEFGSFRVDAARRVLQRDTQAVVISDKAFDLLLVLIQGRDRILEKNELLDAVWPKLVVEQNNLTVAMSALRKALGEGPLDHRYIVTVPRRGYRFVAEVRDLRGDPSALEASPSRPRGTTWRVLLALCAIALIAAPLLIRYGKRPESAANLAVHSLAVLPFKVIGGSADDRYLGVGMADAITTKLGSLGRLKVRPTAAVLRYDGSNVGPVDAGRDLVVDAVLAGTIQQDGKQIRVTVQLVNIATSATIWAETFDESATNVFAMEDSISTGATAHLLRELTNQERGRLTAHATQNPDAYRDYMKGRYFWDKDTEQPMLKSIGYFQAAIADDPNFSLAYAGIADAYTELVLQGYVAAIIGLPKAKDAAEKALNLDSSLAEPHTALAVVAWGYDRNWEQAEHEFNLAAALKPDSASVHASHAFFLMTMKRFEESINEAKHASDLNPTSASIATTVGYANFAAGRFEESAKWLKQAVDLDPSFAFPRALLAVDYALTDANTNVAAQYAAIRDVARSANDPLVAAMAAYACAVSGQRPEAADILQRLKSPPAGRYVDPYSIAIVYAGLGNDSEALDWLDRTYQEHSLSIVFLNVDPYFSAIRANPRFTELAGRAGLPK
jgi:DNA-binding winged helix-turn-helix (wHTH) protein/TolB-like protein/tetratricopeptide (TPR) repeat protein